MSDDGTMKATLGKREISFFLTHNGLGAGRHGGQEAMLNKCHDGDVAAWRWRDVTLGVVYCYAMTFVAGPDGGVYHVERRVMKPLETPLTKIMHSDVAMYRAGVAAGMGDARNVAERMRMENRFAMYRMVAESPENYSDIDSSFSQGWVAGWTAVKSGVMA